MSSISYFTGFSKYGYNLTKSDIERHNSLLLATYYCGIDDVYNQLLDNYKNKDQYPQIIKINVINDYLWYIYTNNNNMKLSRKSNSSSCNATIHKKTYKLNEEISSKKSDHSSSSCDTIIVQYNDSGYDEVSSKYYEDSIL